MFSDLREPGHPSSPRRRARPLLSGVALILAGVLIGTVLPRPGALAAASGPASVDPLAAVRQVYNLILQRFAGRVTPQALVSGAIQGMVQAAGDPFTEYFTSSQNRSFTNTLNGFDGIGVAIVAEGQGEVIQSVIAGGPAQKAGLRSGELIVAVDGRSIAGLGTNQVAALVQGAAGTPVTLTYIDPFQGNAKETVTLTRALIQQPSVFGSSLAPGIGLIRIAEFSSNTAAEWDKVYASLQTAPGGLRGLIIDLRDNPGGYVSAALHIADALAPAGPLFQTVGAHGTVTTYSAPAHPPAPPLVILVNGNTASAAEILAGALQYTDAALLVGSRTYGKGSIQELFSLPGGGAVKLTVEHDQLPNGKSWNHVGLQPDVPAQPAPSPLAALPTFADVGSRDLARGMVGLDVLGLQQRLTLLGNYRGPEDGVYGTMTQASVEVFQHLSGLPVTGVMGPADWRALSTAVAARIKVLSAQPLPDAVLQKGLQVLRGLMARQDGTRAARG